MTETVHLPHGIKPDVPVPARIYDDFPGAAVSFPSARAAAGRVRELIPMVITQASSLLTAPATVRVAAAGLAGRESLLGHPELRAGDPVRAGSDRLRWSYRGVGRVPLPGGPRATAAGNDGQASQPQQHQQMEEL